MSETNGFVKHYRLFLGAYSLLKRSFLCLLFVYFKTLSSLELWTCEILSGKNGKVWSSNIYMEPSLTILCSSGFLTNLTLHRDVIAIFRRTTQHCIDSIVTFYTNNSLIFASLFNLATGFLHITHILCHHQSTCYSFDTFSHFRKAWQQRKINF